MNDFTKDELLWLYETLEWIVEDFIEPDSTYVIKNKIQSLIDNYCEHPENMSMYSLGVEYCVKCKSKLNE